MDSGSSFDLVEFLRVWWWATTLVTIFVISSAVALWNQWKKSKARTRGE